MTDHPTTSRLCVKNLPAYIDEHRLREHFGEKGEVTDAKVIRARSDSASRRRYWLALLAGNGIALRVTIRRHCMSLQLACSTLHRAYILPLQ